MQAEYGQVALDKKFRNVDDLLGHAEGIYTSIIGSQPSS